MSPRLPRWSLALAVGLVTPAGHGPAAVRAAPSAEPGPGFPVAFFPPAPPVYGARIADRPTGTPWLFNGRRLLPPGGLGDFVGETFYPPLSSHLYAGTLSRELETRIEQYRAHRNRLVNELLDQAVLLQAAAEAAREQGWRQFAAHQTPRIVALEAEAEELRRGLIRNGPGSGVDWNSQRRWKLESFPPSREWANREAEFQVVRAAAFYEDGLVAAQRGLLRELAIELASAARKARGEPGDRLDSDALFFSPETTRLRLPSDLPPAVLARVAAFNAQRARLKRQLRELVHAQDQQPREVRTAAFNRLAEEQWPHLGNLETLAEEIRRDLAPHFEPVAPSRPPAIPAWLVAVIEQYNDERDWYFADLRRAVQEAVGGVLRPSRVVDPEEQARQDEEFERLRRRVQHRAIIEFQEQNALRFADLDQRQQAIRKALEIIAASTTDPSTGRTLNVDGLLRQHLAVMAEFERYGRTSTLYGNYRLAMLQSGLSPEQRRLLLSHTLAALAQPLPRGEPLPRRLAKGPLPH